MADEDNAQIGLGTALSYWNAAASPPAYEAIGNILSMDPPGVTRPEVESTTLDSDEAEFINGVRTSDQMKVTATLNAVGYALLKNWVNDGDNVEFKLGYAAPASITEYFTGKPLSYKPGSVTPNGLIQVDFTTRVTGGISETNPHA